MTFQIVEKLVVSCDAVYYDKEKDEEIHCNNSASHEFAQDRHNSIEQERDFQMQLEQKGWDINEETHICPECCERLKKGEIELL